ncbi:hypothetical protein L4C54_14010 [Vibrio lamellibrachiae]|uniref:Flp family type IVb pilin n=1 Tax=Vibrio lamellibrachiae TaxID=2910253 RepID=UPI003D09B81D
MMNHFLKTINEFIDDEEGLTFVEYLVGAGALIVGLSGLFTVFYGILSGEMGSIFDDPE